MCHPADFYNQLYLKEKTSRTISGIFSIVSHVERWMPMYFVPSHSRGMIIVRKTIESHIKKISFTRINYHQVKSQKTLLCILDFWFILCNIK